MYGISDMLVSLVEGSGALWPDLEHKLQAGSAASMATQFRCAAAPSLDEPVLPHAGASPCTAKHIQEVTRRSQKSGGS